MRFSGWEVGNKLVQGRHPKHLRISEFCWNKIPSLEKATNCSLGAFCFGWLRVEGYEKEDK